MGLSNIDLANRSEIRGKERVLNERLGMDFHQGKGRGNEGALESGSLRSEEP